MIHRMPECPVSLARSTKSNSKSFCYSAAIGSNSNPSIPLVTELQDAHSERPARSSLGETTTPHNRSLVVDLHAIDCDRRGESRALPRFFHAATQRNRTPERHGAPAPQHAEA